MKRVKVLGSIGRTARSVWFLPGMTLGASLLLVTQTGCAVEQEGEEVSQHEQEVVKGTDVTRGSLADFGIVALVDPGSTLVTPNSLICTGTLLTNQHVLTARHCVRTAVSQDPPTNSIFNWDALRTLDVILQGPTAEDDQVRSATVILEGAGAVGTRRLLPDEDFAVLQLSEPMVFDTTSIDEFFMEVDTRSSMPAGTSSFCAGYGLSNFASAGLGGNWFPTGGGGTLRSATLTAIAQPPGMSADAFVLGVNADAQTTLNGDSGSTCFINNRIQGIASTTYLPSYTDFDQDGTLEINEMTGSNGATYNAPWDFRARVLQAITTNVSITYRMVPATLPGGSVDYSTTSSGSTLTLPSTGVDRTVGSGLTAIRSGRVQVTVVEPSRTMCQRVAQPAPLSGNTSIRGVCMNDGLMVSLL